MDLSDHALNKTAKIYLKVKGAVNDFGEADFTLNTSVESVQITHQPLREEIEFSARGTNYIIRDIVYMNYRTDINPNDIIEIDGVQYKIISVMDDGGREHHLKLYVVK